MKWYMVSVNEAEVKIMAKTLGVREVLITSSIKRGFRVIEEIRRFLFPHISHLYPSTFFPHLRGVLLFFNEVIERQESPLIWGHHDMDGVGSAYVIYRLFKEYGIEPHIYIPSRKDRYGVNVDIVKKYGRKYVILVDYGISSYEEINSLIKEGFRFVIIDHHEPSRSVPSCPLINPKVHKKYPFMEMCGAGLSLRVFIEFFIDQGLNLKEIIHSYKDSFVIAAMSTFADRVPLIEDNRVITSYGVKLFKEAKNTPFLIKVNEELNGSLINREFMEKINPIIYSLLPEEAMELLISKDMSKVERLYKKGKDEAEKWLSLKAELLKKALSQLEGDGVLFVIDENINEKFLGTIASAIKKETGKPVIVIGRKDSGEWAGEARSDRGFNILEFISNFADLFINYGGHKQACGFSLLEKNVKLLKEELIKHSREVKWQKDESNIIVDGILPIDELDKDLLLLSPFGEMNPYPYFFCPQRKVLYSIDERLNIINTIEV